MTSAIPQPRALPILGNLPDIDTHKPVQSIMKLARTHGPIFQLSLVGRTPTFLCSRELVDEVCDESRFGKQLHTPLLMVRDFAGDGLFTARTEEPNWAKAHRLLMPAFGPLGIRDMFARMLDVAEQMLTRWERFGPDAVIGVADNMTRLTLDTIALCAFDYRFNSFYQNEMHPFVAAMVGALKEAEARANRPDLASRVLLLTKRRYESDVAQMNAVADALIAGRRAERREGGTPDLLDTMLEGRDPATGEGLSDENIRYQMVTFLIAGHETTSGLLSFALYFLLQNPEVMRTAQALVDEVLGPETPRVEDLGKLRYIEQILMESLRLWPTAPAFGLTPKAATTLAGRYPVAPGETLMVLTPMLHRDPAVWDDPEAFRPERFAVDAARELPANAWKPFGNGDRACIGRGFAMQEAHLVLTMVLQRFDLEQADPGYTLEIAETLTLKPHGYRVRARRRGGRLARPRAAAPQAPQRALAPQRARGAEPNGAATTPLLVLYGSNTGSCEAFAQRIGGEAEPQGYKATVTTMDAHVGALPSEGAIVVVTSSYEGHPPDNARRFMPWLEQLGSDALKGVHFAVLGCGNNQWARTYMAVPKRTDAALEKAGATRVMARGEADAGGDFFGGFEDWYAALWPALGKALGKEAVAPDAGAGGLDVEIVHAGRGEALNLADLRQGRVVENRELVDMASPRARSKRHIEIALPAGVSYRTGDYLAVLPRNPRDSVFRALQRFGLAPDTQIVLHKSTGTTHLPTGYPITATEVLLCYAELAQPATRPQVEQLASAARCPPDREALANLAAPEAYEAEVLAKRLSLLDLLERYPSCDMSLAGFLAALPPMRARQYSISSSPLRDADRCSLTVSVLDAPALSGGHRFQGVASSFLAGLAPGDLLSVAVRPSQRAFHPPEDTTVPMIMVCAGSGVAPFHGFLQERAIQKAAGREVGPSLLFFGCDDRDVDFLYHEELRAWQEAGVVDVRAAFSAASEDGVTFVQDRVWKDRADVTDLFRRGAGVFVCGDGTRMAPAVRATFVRIYQDALGVRPEAAAAWADKLERETSRYVADVFA